MNYTLIIDSARCRSNQLGCYIFKNVMEKIVIADVRRNVLIDAIIPKKWAVRVHPILLDFIVMMAFALFVALFAQITFYVPWTPVPVTGQTFAVLVTGGALGFSRGIGALAIYMLMGLLSLPVFAPSSVDLALNLESGWAVHMIFPWHGSDTALWEITTKASFGYIVGFVFAGALVGHFSDRAWDRKPMGILVMFLANILVYIPGLIWLWVVLGPMKGETLSLSQVLQWGLYPFIVGDLMKLYLAFLTLPIAWSLVGKIKRGNS